MNTRFTKSTEQFVNQIYDYLENVVGEDDYNDYFIEDKKNELSRKSLDEYLFDLADYLSDCVLDNRSIAYDSRRKRKHGLVSDNAFAVRVEMDGNPNDYGYLTKYGWIHDKKEFFNSDKEYQKAKKEFLSHVDEDIRRWAIFTKERID